MEWGQQLDITQQNAKDALYHNTNYNFERISKNKIILDVLMSCEEGGMKFKCPFLNPLIIDRLSTVSIEYFITYGAKPNTQNENMSFVIHFDQLNLNTDYGTNILNYSNCAANNQCGRLDTEKYRSLIIPNEAGRGRAITCSNDDKINFDDHGDSTTTVNHKGFKTNYVCSVNPMTLSELSGTITDAGSYEDGNLVYRTPFNLHPNCKARFIMELIIQNV